MKLHVPASGFPTARILRRADLLFLLAYNSNFVVLSVSAILSFTSGFHGFNAKPEEIDAIGPFFLDGLIRVCAAAWMILSIPTGVLAIRRRCRYTAVVTVPAGLLLVAVCGVRWTAEPLSYLFVLLGLLALPLLLCSALIAPLGICEIWNRAKSTEINVLGCGLLHSGIEKKGSRRKASNSITRVTA